MYYSVGYNVIWSFVLSLVFSHYPEPSSALMPEWPFHNSVDHLSRHTASLPWEHGSCFLAVTAGAPAHGMRQGVITCCLGAGANTPDWILYAPMITSFLWWIWWRIVLFCLSVVETWKLRDQFLASMKILQKHSSKLLWISLFSYLLCSPFSRKAVAASQQEPHKPKHWEECSRQSQAVVQCCQLEWGRLVSGSPVIKNTLKNTLLQKAGSEE